MYRGASHRVGFALAAFFIKDGFKTGIRLISLYAV